MALYKCMKINSSFIWFDWNKHEWGDSHVLRNLIESLYRKCQSVTLKALRLDRLVERF